MKKDFGDESHSETSETPATSKKSIEKSSLKENLDFNVPQEAEDESVERGNLKKRQHAEAGSANEEDIGVSEEENNLEKENEEASPEGNEEDEGQEQELEEEIQKPKKFNKKEIEDKANVLIDFL